MSVKKCSLCSKPAMPLFQPFCSKACRDQDLLKWLSDAYKIPATPTEIDLEEEDLMDDLPHTSPLNHFIS